MAVFVSVLVRNLDLETMASHKVFVSRSWSRHWEGLGETKPDYPVFFLLNLLRMTAQLLQTAHITRQVYYRQNYASWPTYDLASDVHSCNKEKKEICNNDCCGCLLSCKPGSGGSMNSFTNEQRFPGRVQRDSIHAWILCSVSESPKSLNPSQRHA